MPEFGALAAGVDYRIPLERLALVPDAGPDWPKTVATLLDGVAMVVVKPPDAVSQATVRALQARARERGSVSSRPAPGLALTSSLSRPDSSGTASGKAAAGSNDRRPRSG